MNYILLNLKNHFFLDIFKNLIFRYIIKAIIPKLIYFVQININQLINYNQPKRYRTFSITKFNSYFFISF